MSVPQASLLRAGSNILAIQALNDTAANAHLLGAPAARRHQRGHHRHRLSHFAHARCGEQRGEDERRPVRQRRDEEPESAPDSAPRRARRSSSRAKVIPELRPLAAANPVQLKYAVMFGAEQTVNMTPLPRPPTTSITASIPTGTLGAGQMLRWRVVATDNTGVTGTGARVFRPDSTTSSTTAPSRSIRRSRRACRCSTGFGRSDRRGQRHGHALLVLLQSARRYRRRALLRQRRDQPARPEQRRLSEKELRPRFQRGQPLRVERRADERVKDINLLTNWGDKSKTHNQMTHEAFATVGAASITGAIKCACSRSRRPTPRTPANHFLSIADMMEDGDDDFMERNGRDPERRALQDLRQPRGQRQRGEEDAPFENKTDLDALIAGAQPVSNDPGHAPAVCLRQPRSAAVRLLLRRLHPHEPPGSRAQKLLRLSRHASAPANGRPCRGTWTSRGAATGRIRPAISPTPSSRTTISTCTTPRMQGKGENRLYSLFVGNSDVGRAARHGVSRHGAAPAAHGDRRLLQRARRARESFHAARRSDGSAGHRHQRCGSRLHEVGHVGQRRRTPTGGAAMRYHINQIRNVYLPGRRTFLNDRDARRRRLPPRSPRMPPI